MRALSKTSIISSRDESAFSEGNSLHRAMTACTRTVASLSCARKMSEESMSSYNSSLLDNELYCRAIRIRPTHSMSFKFKAVSAMSCTARNRTFLSFASNPLSRYLARRVAKRIAVVSSSSLSFSAKGHLLDS